MPGFRAGTSHPMHTLSLNRSVHMVDMAAQRGLGAVPVSSHGQDQLKHYEIRVLGEDGKTKLIYHARHVDDMAAFQAAKEIADGQTFDLWRGMDCVFAGRFAGHQLVH